MPISADLVKEVTTTTGTGALTLSASTARRFSTVFGTGSTENVFWVATVHRTENEWEIASAHMSDANTLVRDTIIASSNSNSAVDFSAGTKDVISDIPYAFQLRGPGSAVNSNLASFDGTTGSLIKDSGVSPSSIKSYTWVRQVFLSSGTYTPTSGMVSANVRMQAAGGGGGGADGTGDEAFIGTMAGGGGGGEYTEKTYTAAEIGSSATISLGSGGTAGSNTGGNGGTGGTASFNPAGTGATISAVGGSGGVGSGSNASGSLGSSNGGIGGTGGSNGDFHVPGQAGSPTFEWAFYDANVGGSLSGAGGNAKMGMGGQARRGGSDGLGQDQTGDVGGNYGGGGSGAVDNDTTGSTGGAGAPGVCIVDELVAT